MIDLLSDVWDAFLDLPWSVVALTAVLLLFFRRDFPSLIRRVKRVHVPGFDVEFYEDLHQLQENAAKAADVGTSEDRATLSLTSQSGTLFAGTATATARADADLIGGETADKPQDRTDDIETIVNAILDEAAADPKVALIRLSIEIEKGLTIILGRAGFLAGQRYIPLPKALRIIESDYKVLSEPVMSAIQSFWRVRNQIIHGGEGNRDAVLSAIDSGLMVFKTLRQQPFARFYVLQADLPVYVDEAGINVRDDLKALVLEEVGAGGLVRTKHLVLTTRSHYKPGMEVAWEWDTNHHINAPVWRRDPDTGKLVGSDKYGPMEFVGRDIADFRIGT